MVEEGLWLCPIWKHAGNMPVLFSCSRRRRDHPLAARGGSTVAAAAAWRKAAAISVHGRRSGSRWSPCASVPWSWPTTCCSLPDCPTRSIRTTRWRPSKDGWEPCCRFFPQTTGRFAAAIDSPLHQPLTACRPPPAGSTWPHRTETCSVSATVPLPPNSAARVPAKVCNGDATSRRVFTCRMPARCAHLCRLGLRPDRVESGRVESSRRPNLRWLRPEAALGKMVPKPYRKTT